MASQRFKESVFRGADLLGFNASLRALNLNKLLILCYHSVLPADEACGECNATVPIQQFRRQMETICRLLVPVTPEAVSKWVQGQSSLPKRAVLLTIDDGFLNSWAYAAPELLRLGIPAVLSVMTGYVETGRFLWTHRLRQSILHWPEAQVPHPKGEAALPLPREHARRCFLARELVNSCKSLPEDTLHAYVDFMTRQVPKNAFDHLEKAHTFLTWENIRRLHGQGFTIASHGVEHIALSRLSGERLDYELRESKRTIETKLNATCDWITYPFGGRDNVSDAVVARARDAGYRCGLTLFGTGIVKPSEPLLLDRVCIDGLDGRSVFLGQLSGLNRWASWSKSTLFGDNNAAS